MGLMQEHSYSYDQPVPSCCKSSSPCLMKMNTLFWRYCRALGNRFSLRANTMHNVLKNVPWTVSWLLASSVPARGSTGCCTVLCPPCQGPRHWRSLGSRRLTVAPADSKWRGPEPACFGSRHHGNCSISWRQGEGVWRLTLKSCCYWMEHVTQPASKTEPWQWIIAQTMLVWRLMHIL